MKRATLVFTAIVLLSNCLPLLAQAPAGVNSREIKILLRTDAFEGPEAFFESSLETLRALASERKVKLREPGGEPKVKTREIRYFDRLRAIKPHIAMSAGFFLFDEESKAAKFFAMPFVRQVHGIQWLDSKGI